MPLLTTGTDQNVWSATTSAKPAKDQQPHAGVVLTLPTESMDLISARVLISTMIQEYQHVPPATTAVSPATEPEGHIASPVIQILSGRSREPNAHVLSTTMMTCLDPIASNVTTAVIPAQTEANARPACPPTKEL